MLTLARMNSRASSAVQTPVPPRFGLPRCTPMSSTTRAARMRWPSSIPRRSAGFCEVAELVHQALGVERPALGVTAGAGEAAAPGVEQRAVVDGLAELQVMTGNALVVDRRGLAPGVELGDALGHAPPHPARPAEVVVRRGVVDAALLGRGDHALDRLDSGRGCRSGCPRARRPPGRRAAASTSAARRCRAACCDSSASRKAIASSTEAPGLIWSAIWVCSSTMRASSSMPHS